MTQKVSAAEFSQFVSAKKFAVIHFDAPWDGVGEPLRPRMFQAEGLFSNLVNFGEFNADHWDSIIEHVSFQCVPTIAFFRDGQLVVTYTGATQDIVAETKALISGECPKYVHVRPTKLGH